jgi:hypothetical protein
MLNFKRLLFYFLSIAYLEGSHIDSYIQGQIVLVQSKMANANGGTTQPVTMTSTPKVGNVMVVGFENINSGSPGHAFVTDNQANGGNQYVALSWFPQTTVIGAMLYCAPVVVASGTFTITGTVVSNQSATIYAREYSGASCNVDRSIGATGTTSPYACGSLITNNARDVLISLINSNSGANPTNFTVPSSFGNQQSQTNGTQQSGSIADNIVSVTGTYVISWVVSNNATANCTTVALKASAGFLGFP